MNLVYHRAVQRDVTEIIRHYDEAGGPALGDAFFTALLAAVASAQAHPTRHHRVQGKLRRINLARFPYHILFRIVGDTVRVLVVRHHRRNPHFGLGRL